MSDTSNIFKDQHEFMAAAGNAYPFCTTDEMETLAERLVREEYLEFIAEPCGSDNKIKEALDLIYVTAQYLNTVIGPETAFKLWVGLHTNNMSKCRDGVLVKRDDGKILKPEGYVAFDVADELKKLSVSE